MIIRAGEICGVAGDVERCSAVKCCSGVGLFT